MTVNRASKADALNRVLLAAAGKINSELGRATWLAGNCKLAAQVNLARAKTCGKR